MTPFTLRIAAVLLPLAMFASIATADTPAKSAKKTAPTAAPQPSANTSSLAKKPGPAANPFADLLKGGKKVKAFASQIESPDPMIFPVKAGHCYVIVMRLGEGASMPEKTVSMDWPTHGGDQMPGAFGVTRETETAGAFKPDCATVKADVGLWTGLHTFPGMKPYGKGPVSFEVYERKGTAAELKAEAAADQSFHEQNTKQRDAARAKTCGECGTPVGGRRICLERRGLTMGDCGW
jgi:hypothetical protein